MSCSRNLRSPNNRLDGPQKSSIFFPEPDGSGTRSGLTPRNTHTASMTRRTPAANKGRQVSSKLYSAKFMNENKDCGRTWRRFEVLDDCDVVLCESVERSEGRLENGNGFTQLLVTIVLDRLSSLCLVVCDRLVPLKTQEERFEY